MDVDAREWANGLTFSATYFNIDFRDRIQNPAFGPDILDDPVFGSLITRNPTAGRLAAPAARVATFLEAPRRASVARGSHCGSAHPEHAAG